MMMMLVSSAHGTNFALPDKANGRSLIYKIKSRGPKMEPCGTPCFMGFQVEK
jgi:hypothetical protein